MYIKNIKNIKYIKYYRETNFISFQAIALYPIFGIFLLDLPPSLNLPIPPYCIKLLFLVPYHEPLAVYLNNGKAAIYFTIIFHLYFTQSTL